MTFRQTINKEETMAKIKHIAIKVEDQEKAAAFYKETFGMTEAWRGPMRDDGKRGQSILPTDTSIWRSCPRVGGGKGSITFALKWEIWKGLGKPRGPQALKAMRRRSLGTVALLKWEFTIRRDNSLMSGCTAGKRRPLFSPSPHSSPVDGEEANPGIGDKARESLDNPN